jgi:uncharacterized protein YjbI with pentapeptide repeats
MKIGDFVKGVTGSPYGITTDKMTRGVIVDVKESGNIEVKVLEHADGGTGKHIVDPQYFEVIGHVNPFNRDEVLELLKNGCKKALLDYDLSGANLIGANLRRANLSGANLSEANLSEANLSEADLREADLSEANLGGANLSEANLGGANLRRANLREADLDFSCWPLWCGGLHVKTDKRLAVQFAYHLCSMQCDDDEYIAMRNSILEFANQFHRVGECGKLGLIESGDKK